MTDITNLCSNYTADSTTLKNIAVSMKSYFDNYRVQVNISVIIVPLNKSIGSNITDELFFDDDSPTFDQSVFENFWSNTDSELSNTTEDIQNISNFLINLGNRTRGPKENYYKEFVNPYANFIINYYFCKFKINLESVNPTNKIKVINLYNFLKGATTGDYGGTYGGGTYKLCQFCNTFFENIKNNKASPYTTVSQNTFLQEFCGCCSQMVNYLPSYFTQDGTSLTLPCIPICNKNETIKPYEGASPFVNNGYFNDFNTSLGANPSYTRRFCEAQTVCVIDNVNISIFQGDSQIKFNQICPGCDAQGGCICYIDFSDGGTIDSVEGFQNPVTFKQNCPISLCSQEKDGKTIFLPCNPNNTSDTGKEVDLNYNHDGQPNLNSSQQNRDTYIFGLSNWLVPVVFIFIAIFVTVSILIVNYQTAKREIYIIDKQKKFEK